MSESGGFLVQPGGERLAWKCVQGRGRTVLWLGGFASDMSGTKAEHLAAWARDKGHAYVRFDYSGHGASDGAFKDGTIGSWRDDALAALDGLTEAPVVLAGSSMGGWIACLLALARPERIAGMVLIAPAPDFTDKLIWPRLDEAARRQIETEGAYTADGAAAPFTRALIEDGAAWSILPGPVRIDVPVRILQGAMDEDVPWRHALELHEALTSQDCVFSLIKDGDHRLSRPQDLERMVAAVEELSAEP